MCCCCKYLTLLHASGFDAAEGDPLGGCKVTPQGYGAMTQALISGIPSASGRVVLVLEGGYNLESIARSFAACASKLIDHAATTAANAAAATVPQLSHSGDSQQTGSHATQTASVQPRTLSKGYQKTINDVRRLHSRYWKSLRGLIAQESPQSTKTHGVAQRRVDGLHFRTERKLVW